MKTYYIIDCPDCDEPIYCLFDQPSDKWLYGHKGKFAGFTHSKDSPLVEPQPAWMHVTHNGGYARHDSVWTMDIPRITIDLRKRGIRYPEQEAMKRLKERLGLQ